MVSAGMGAIADYRHPGAHPLLSWISSSSFSLMHLQLFLSGSGRLPDLGFTLIPEMTEYANVPNEFAKAAFVLTVGLVLLHPKRLMVLRRSLVIYRYSLGLLWLFPNVIHSLSDVSMVFLLRAICVVSTALPDPSPLCMGKKPFTPEVFRSSTRHFTVSVFLIVKSPRRALHARVMPHSHRRLFLQSRLIMTSSGRRCAVASARPPIRSPPRRAAISSSPVLCFIDSWQGSISFLWFLQQVTPCRSCCVR